MRYPSFIDHNPLTGYDRDQSAGGSLGAVDDSLGWIELIRAHEGMKPWGMGRPRPPIEAYLQTDSCMPGDTVAIHASSGNDVPRVRMQVFKEPLGESVLVETEFDSQPRPIRRGAWWRGAGWPVSHTLTIPTSWSSGVYRLELSDASGVASYVHCVLLCIRAAQPGEKSKIVLKLSTNSYYAYNNWGGHSMYGFHSIDTWEWKGDAPDHIPAASYKDEGVVQEGSTQDLITGGGLQSHRVSPYRPGHGYYGSIEGRFLTWERVFLLWAHRQGMEVDLCTDEDVRLWPLETLCKYNVIVSVGHDEYYTGGQIEAMSDFVDKGGNIAFLSGNLATWNCRYAPDGEEEPLQKDGPRSTELAGYPFVGGADTGDVEVGKYMVCFKQFLHRQSESVKSNPLLCTGYTMHPLVGKARINDLIGVCGCHGGYHLSHGNNMKGNGAYTVQTDGDWLLEGTGLKAGDLLGTKTAVVGYECDGVAFRMPTAGSKVGAVPIGGDGTPDSFKIVGLSLTDDGQRACWWGGEMVAPMPSMEAFEGEARRAALEAKVQESVDARHEGTATLGYFTRPGGGMVVSVGSTDWPCGLLCDPSISKVTANIFERFMKLSSEPPAKRART